MDRNNLLIAYTLLISLAFFPATTEACPSNGSHLVPKGRAEAGIEYNIMYRRDIERSYGELRTQDLFYTVSLGIFDWLALDGKIGIGDIRHRNSPVLPDLEYRTAFAGGYGFRAELFRHRPSGIRIIGGAQHISVHPQDTTNGNNKYESFLDDWQVSALVVKDLRYASLYAGGKLSDCEIVYKTNKHDKKRRFSEDHVGFIGGMDICLPGDRLRLNAELRLFDETAFSTGISYSF
ncbi:MAG: hypothetical protein PHH49_05920 [Candidatus Omnitrophica bacterium]|nr:hypothetical protein [Candidatus Omnitrophota bacterium]MDD5488478.1 hypothetical protein [Candidatus Omnitrophota bacterium]